MRERYFSRAGFLTQLEVPSPNLYEPWYILSQPYRAYAKPTLPH